MDAALDRMFAALADPTRRALLARLEVQDSISVSDLAKPFPVSLPAIMKHLDVLSDAGLVTRSKTGRTVTCRLNAGPMEQAMHWLQRYQRFWSAQLDRLVTFIEEEAACPPKPKLKLVQPKGPVSHSSDASRPRRRKSTAPGSIRRK